MGLIAYFVVGFLLSILFLIKEQDDFDDNFDDQILIGTIALVVLMFWPVVLAAYLLKSIGSWAGSISKKVGR